MITEEQVSQLLPSNEEPGEMAKALSLVLPKYGITTRNRVAGFLAQCGHESRDFTRLTENLNYSAERLRQVFPKRFPTVASARPYERNPEKTGNRIYAGKIGNGDEASGDGYRFRGRGAIQLTGRANYQAFAAAIGKTLDEIVSYCETLEGAVESACWFWDTQDINVTCDQDDILRMTRKINGGTNGLEDRKARYAKAKHALPNPVF